MFQFVRNIGAIIALAALAACGASTAPDQRSGTAGGGVGVPPANSGEYTPGRFGTVQIGSPLAPDYSSLEPVSRGCNWAPTYGDNITQNYAYPESNATYWQATSPIINAAGTRIRIEGQIPNARFFSISLYNANYQLLGTLHDYSLVTHSGATPYLSKTVPNNDVHYGDGYTAYVVFGPEPAQPEQNTVYVPPQPGGQIFPGAPSIRKLVLLYRVYVPGGSTASGDVPLPVLTINDVPFSDKIDSLVCQDIASELQQNLRYAVPIAPGGPDVLPPKNPTFTTFQDRGIPGFDAAVNGDNQFMSARTRLPANYLYLIRGKAPSYTTSPMLSSGEVPNMRYFSICQNATTSQEVIGCVGDFQSVQEGGFYNIVVSGGDTPQQFADAAHGFNWMPFGPKSPGTVIYRQLLAADGFSGAIGTPTIGAFMPKIAYCTISQFEALAQQFPNSPDQVFTGCGGAPD